MPRRERPVQRRSITASAKNYSPRRSSRRKKQDEKTVRGGEAWQHAVWTAYDVVPEFHQGCNIVGALLSRARLLVMERQSDGSYKPTENPVALAALDEFYGGVEGHAEMLRMFGIHATAAGEAYIVGPGGDIEQRMNPSKWNTWASIKVSRPGGRQWRVGGKELPGKPFVMKIWVPHPVDPTEPDSDARSALPSLSQIMQLDKRTSAIIDSRLRGGGLVLFPDETSFPASPTRFQNPGDPATFDDGLENDAQGLMDVVYDAAEKAIEDPASAEAALPIFATAPGEHIGNVKLINFWSDLDKEAPKLRNEKLMSVARALRMPPEVLLGSEGSNHWNMWLSDENNVKIFGEPLLKIFTSSITTDYLWDALEGEDGIANPQDFIIAADTSQMRLRPNRSKEATEIYDRGELSATAMRRENGFEEGDAPTEEERKRQLLFRAAGGSTTPELVEAALREEGVELELLEIRDTRPPVEARPTPSLEQHPVREIPERPAASLDIGLVFAAEQLIDRALQRAGNRMKTKYGLKQPPSAANRLYMHVRVPAGDLDDVLQDAWSTLNEFDYGVEPEKLERALDTFTRMCIGAQKIPDRKSIQRALALLLSRNAA